MGKVNPFLHMKASLKALRWAIASCYDHRPVFNTMLARKSKQTSARQACLQHHCVQKLACVQGTAAILTVSSLFRRRCSLDIGDLLCCSVKLVTVANSAGLALNLPRNMAKARRAIRGALQKVCSVKCEVYGIKGKDQTLPPQHSMNNFAAIYPPGVHQQFMQRTSTDHLLVMALQPPSLLLDTSSIMYIDGSKQGCSITAAWIQPQSGSSQILCDPGLSSLRSTALRGEPLAIHAAHHSQSFPMDQSMHLMTDSLTSLYLTGACLVRPSYF